LSGERIEHRLAAILVADVAGYSRLMGEAEEGTHRTLKAHLRELVNPTIEKHRGRLIKNTGDGVLVEFPSVVDSIRCAIEIQRGMADRNRETPDSQRITFRIGINIGDVIVEPDDIYGDGVNIAARLESISEPGGICISDDAFRQVRGRTDIEFSDIGERELKNISRPIRVYRARLPTGLEMVAVARSSADKLSIAVLPFVNMSGDPELQYFADGIAEDIFTALSRVRWLTVIARNLSIIYRSHAVNVKQVGRELGVRYVLKGSVRKAGGQVRIAAQLIDTDTGVHLWADRFDGSFDNTFELQDAIAIAVSGVIEPTLDSAEIRRSAEQSSNELDAHHLYLRARRCRRSFEREQLLQAIQLCMQAIQRDPEYGVALSFVAVCHLDLAQNDWIDDYEANRQQALNLARRALRISADDPRVLSDAAMVLAYLDENTTIATALIDRALSLNPSYARGWNISGAIRLAEGRTDLAIEHFERSAQLDPSGRIEKWAQMGIGIACFFNERFQDAVARFQLALEHLPNVALIYRFLAASYAHLGRLAEAHATVTRLRALTAPVLPTLMPYRDDTHRKLLWSGLRRAMGEEMD
jgi:TolB-like protein/class 3 adenylate cyclase